MTSREKIVQMQIMLEQLLEMLDNDEPISEHPHIFANDLFLVGEMAYSLSEEIQEENDTWLDEDEDDWTFDDDGYDEDDDEDDFDYVYEE